MARISQRQTAEAWQNELEHRLALPPQPGLDPKTGKAWVVTQRAIQRLKTIEHQKPSRRQAVQQERRRRLLQALAAGQRTTITKGRKGQPAMFRIERGPFLGSCGSLDSDEQQRCRLKGWYPKQDMKEVIEDLAARDLEIFWKAQEGASYRASGREYHLDRRYISKICHQVYKEIQGLLYLLDLGLLFDEEIPYWTLFQQFIAPHLTHPKRQPSPKDRKAGFQAAIEAARNSVGSDDPALIEQAEKEARQFYHQHILSWNQCRFSEGQVADLTEYIRYRLQRRTTIFPPGTTLPYIPVELRKGGKFPPHIRTKKYFKERQAKKTAWQTKLEQEEIT